MAGFVEDVGIRVTRIRDVSGAVRMIPNRTRASIRILPLQQGAVEREFVGRLKAAIEAEGIALGPEGVRVVYVADRSAFRSGLDRIRDRVTAGPPRTAGGEGEGPSVRRARRAAVVLTFTSSSATVLIRLDVSARPWRRGPRRLTLVPPSPSGAAPTGS